MLLVYTTQVSNAYRARWLAGSEVNSKFYSPPSSLWDKIARREFNFWPRFGILKEINLFFFVFRVVFTNTIINLSVGKMVVVLHNGK